MATTDQDPHVDSDDTDLGTSVDPEPLPIRPHHHSVPGMTLSPPEHVPGLARTNPEGMEEEALERQRQDAEEFRPSCVYSGDNIFSQFIGAKEDYKQENWVW